jgi:hypothetical protein
MFRTSVDLELLQHATSEARMREHLADRLAHDGGGIVCDHIAHRFHLEAARIAREAVIELVLALVAGEVDLLGIDDDHVITEREVR